ncbi:MAG: YdcF family protein [Bacteroidetes bacterium]|jgi:uncharacterized SAM-binding protein YcdF (DUF218 family)|nr:YdcF family protein [Bacteroidota bacterium]
MQHVFFFASKIFDFLLSPLSWIFILLIWALFAKDKLRKRKCFRWAVVLLIVFTNPLLLHFAMHSWETPAIRANDLQKTYDAGIMMGGAIRYINGDMDRPVFGSGADRYMQTAELYYAHKIRHIIISSGSGSIYMTKLKEADLLTAQLIRTGIPDSLVFAESESRNTYENALYTAKLLREKNFKPPFVIVTSALHMRRSIMCFRKQNIDVIPFPVDQHSGKLMFTPEKVFIPATEVMLDWDLLIHEWVGVITYKIMGYA